MKLLLMKIVVFLFFAVLTLDPFREPVPWKEWGLEDYPLIIKQPMDLSTVSVRFALFLNYFVEKTCSW